MAEEQDFENILNQYTYTLPNGNTIITSAESEFLARELAKKDFNQLQSQGAFQGLTTEDLGEPVAKKESAEAYIVRGMDIPKGTEIRQNMRSRGAQLREQGYTVENDVVTAVPPSADPAVKEAFITKLQEHIVGLQEIPQDQLSIYDINGDGQVTTADTVNALRNFQGLSNPEEINTKITNAFSNFVQNSPQLSSEAMIKKIQRDIVGLEKISADELDLYDFNNDGSITIQDTVTALRHNQGLETNEKVASTLGSFHQQNIGMQPETIVEPEPETEPETVDSIEDTQPEQVVKYYVKKDNAGNLSIFESSGYASRGVVFTGSTRKEAEAYINSQKTEKELEQEAMAEAKERQPESEQQPEVVTYGDTTTAQTDQAFGQAAKPIVTTYDTTPTTTTAETAPATTTDTGLTTSAAPATTTSYTPVSATQSVTPSTANLGSTPTFGGGYQAGTVYKGTEFETREGGLQTVMYRNERGQQIPVTLKNGNPITYVPPGYSSTLKAPATTKSRPGGATGFIQQHREAMSAGGFVSLDAENDLATKFLGYSGEKSRTALDNFYQSNSGAAARMGKYQQAMKQFATGGMVRGLEEGGDSGTSGISGEGEEGALSYKDDVIPMFGDALKQTFQPMQAPVSYITPTSDQMIDSSAGQVSATAPYASAATVGTTQTAMTPGVADTATYGATTATGAVRDETKRTKAATGTVSADAQVGAAQGTVSDAAMANAAQFDSNYINRVNMGNMNVTSDQLVNAAGQDEVAPAVKIAQSSGIEPAVAQQATVSVNELPEAAQIAESNMAQAKVAQSGGLLREEATAYAAKLDTFSVDNGTLAKAIQGEVGALGTVQGQLEGLMSQFDDGTPAWAAGAIRAANAAMAARGLGGSSMAGAAILQAAMESALPIAQQDAQTFNQMNMSNLNRRQQVSLTNAAAQQGLALQNLSNEQQVALQNSTNAFALQTQDLSNMQQTFLANAQIKSALQGQNLSNQQQTNLVTAARYAEVSNMNLNNRQQTALVNNANNLQIELSNLSNQQQAYVSNAQLAAALQGKQIDNQQQAAIQNAARFAEVSNINFTAEQQEQLHNSELMKTIGLADLTNRQAAVLQNAATLANMDMANLNNRQQAAVQNAQSFLQMDMANLSNAQQVELFRSQQNVQALFTDQAAENASSQFNATSENQTNQFFASLASQTSQFNATQVNATNQFNVNTVNGIREFNSNLQNQRDQFNANNGLVIAQANAQWRQNIATLNTATQNESNMEFAKTINELTENNLDHVWQRERDLMQYNVETIENSRDRGMQILLGIQDLEALRERIAAGEDRDQTDFLTSFLFDVVRL